MLASDRHRSFDLDRPLDLPSPLTWRQVEGPVLCIAPEQPNWLATGPTGAPLLAALS
jgi:hypothetical protein